MRNTTADHDHSYPVTIRPAPSVDTQPVKFDGQLYAKG
ncbi:hypothetical protein LIG30_1540 [Burkholderia sp. lig30]|nr:hypothetical protein LIG30_1540 [Burkholderia sp. lig30]